MTGRSYSFAMAHGLSKKFGSALLRMGAKKGDVIGLVLPNIPEFPIGMLIQKSILELSFFLNKDNWKYLCENLLV